MAVKTIDGLAIASVKTVKGLAIASVKTFNGETVTAGACSVGTDISNGWCKIAHTIAGSANLTSVTTTGVDTTGADLIVLVISSYGGGGDLVVGNVSDSKSNSWSNAVHQAGSQANALIVYSKPTTVGSAHTFTVSSVANTFPLMAVLAVAGSHATPLDQTNLTFDSSSTSTQTGSITPSQNNELIISGWSLLAVNTGTPTINLSMTLQDFLNSDGVNYQTGGLAYITQSTAGAINPTWSWVVSGVNSAGIVSFKHS